MWDTNLPSIVSLFHIDQIPPLTQECHAYSKKNNTLFIKVKSNTSNQHINSVGIYPWALIPIIEETNID